MIGKISHFLWGTDELIGAAGETMEELKGFEEEGWIIVNLPENQAVSRCELDPLEKPPTEHPGKSVYQMRNRMTVEEKTEDDQRSDDQGEKTLRSLTAAQHVSWRMAAGGIPLFHIQPLRVHRAERKKLSRTALYRQNLTMLRFAPAKKRYGFLKHPCRRLYNY